MSEQPTSAEPVDVEEALIGVSDPMTTATIRRRAIAGVGMIVTRGFLAIVLGLGANIVLARLLLPRDFGLVALGVSVMGFATVLSSAGLGAGLIGRSVTPAREDLETLLALQLSSTVLFVAVTAAVASPFGEKGWVVATMVASLPVSALKTPASVLLERELLYRPLVGVDLLESVVYYGWAVGTVAIGWGVWGLATAVLVRSAAGAVALAVVEPRGIVKPRLSRKRARGLVGFGVRVQATALTHTVRDQVLISGTVALVGLSTLGLWSLANRVLQLLIVVLNALWRVSYPAMSRLINANEDPSRMIERGLGPLAIGIGLFLTALVGSSPASVPVVFGDKWSGAADVLPWAGAAIMVAAPISVVAMGYLYSVGDASTLLRCEVLNALAFWAVAFPLLPSLRLTALGAGWLASALVEATILGRAIASRTKARVFATLWPPTAAAVLGGAAGWILASSSRPTLMTALSGGALAEAVFVCAMLVISRPLLGATVSVVGQAARSSLARAQ
jgi:O-antigen/teichoic acid export membrane protein